MHGSFEILGISFPAYFTLLMIGFMVAIYVGWRVSPSAGIDPNRLLDMGIWAVIGGIIGSRIAHVLFDGQLNYYYYLCVDPMQTTGEFLTSPARYCQDAAQCLQANKGELCDAFTGTCHWGRDCLRVFKFWYGGLTYYGGLLLVVPVGIWLLRRWKINPWKMCDISGFAILIGLGFGRLGCYLAGCCFGDTCDLSWAVEFPAGSPAARAHVEAQLILPGHESLAVHPAQLYAVAANWALAGAMYWWYRFKRSFHGETFWLSILLYGGARFVLEMFRADQRGGFWGVSTSQWLGIAMIVLSFFMLARMWRRHQASGEPDVWAPPPLEPEPENTENETETDS